MFCLAQKEINLAKTLISKSSLKNLEKMSLGKLFFSKGVVSLTVVHCLFGLEGRCLGVPSVFLFPRLLVLLLKL